MLRNDLLCGPDVDSQVRVFQSVCRVTCMVGYSDSYRGVDPGVGGHDP